MDNDRAHLSLFNEKGRERVSLTDDHGLEISGVNAGPRASLEVHEDGPALWFFGAFGEVRASLGAYSNGETLILYDPNRGARERVLLSAGPQRGALLGFSDSNGKTRALLGEDGLEISDEEGFQTIIGTTDLVTPRTGETHKTSAASVVLSDKDKKVLWKAP